MSREALCDSDGVYEIKIEDHLDAGGGIALPDGAILTSYLDRNIATLGDAPAYRYLNFSTADRDGLAVELTWNRLGIRLQAVAARLQQLTEPGDRVAILAPQGIDYVVGFFAAMRVAPSPCAVRAGVAWSCRAARRGHRRRGSHCRTDNNRGCRVCQGLNA